MQYRPDATALLEAIQEFLMKDVLPRVKDDEFLAYKTLVSWNMLGVTARELDKGEPLINEEIARLREHLGESGAAEGLPGEWPSHAKKKELCRALHRRLADEIRTNKTSTEDARTWDLVKESLKDKLRVSNPRFSLD